MFSHIFIGVKDFDRAYRFYADLMALLGNAPRFCDRERRGTAGNRIRNRVRCS